MTKITTTQAADLEYHTQPRDQGQIVEVSYACDPDRGLLVRRSHDRSDGTTVYAAAEIDESLEQDGDFQPWNGGLPVITGDFEPISEAHDCLRMLETHPLTAQELRWINAGATAQMKGR